MYICCPQIPTQQYKISTRTNKVYDISERKVRLFILN